MILTKNFTLEELTITETGLSNIPDNNAMERLLYLATYILQPIRDKCGILVVSSGYRSFEVNKAIGGALTSQHVLGEACDFIPQQEKIEDVFVWIRANMKYGQVIEEHKNNKDWIHISLPRLGKKNNHAMIYENGIYREA